MSDPNFETCALFSVGQIVHHKRFGYRGVVVDVDASFQLSEEWYEHVAFSRPPKNKPWYHVLVHNSDQATYVAERHLEPDSTGEPINHPFLYQFFDLFDGGKYERNHGFN